MMQITLPANASSERTQKVINDMESWLLTNPEVLSVFSPNGFSFSGRGENSAMSFVLLKPWSERNSEQSVQKLAARAMAHFSTSKDAKIYALVPPAVMELGNATGFDFFLQDTQNQGHAALMAARNQFLQMAAKDKRLFATRPNGMEDEPQFHLIIDDERARALGLSLGDINDTLSISWGSSYVNQFTYSGRVKKVYVQGNAGSRVTPEDLKKWYFRNSSGTMVPFTAFGRGEWQYGSPRYERFNGISALEIMGSPGAGYSSGDAVKAVKEIAAKLPPGFKVEWHGLSYEEQMSGSQTPALYTISLVVVFLCLAALYESWSIPFSVILVVPLGVLGTVLAVLLRGLENDVFFQVGLLTTVGLAAKNAILIVEFAKDLHEKEGMGLVEAATEAAKLRIRPIIMTSMAFVLGVMPLAISHGAGAGSQHSIGTAVVGGMLTATFLAIYFVPMFYVVVSQLFSAKKKLKTRYRTMTYKSLSMGLLPMLVLVGCTMEPDYQRPSLPVAAHYTEQGQPLAGNGANIRWQQFFTDPMMHQLIARALQNNRDLRVAALNVEVARSQVTVARSALMPSIDANVGETAAHLPGNLYNTGPGGGVTYHQFDANFGVTAWELDFLAGFVASATVHWNGIWQRMPLSVRHASA